MSIDKLSIRFCLSFICFLIVSTSGYTLQCVRPHCGYSLAEVRMPRMNTHHLMDNFTPRRCLRPVKAIQARGLSTHSLVPYEKKLFNMDLNKISRRWYTQNMSNKLLKIDAALAQQLVASQFPQWKDLPVTPVAVSGWDNRTFHLGKEMLIRMPSDKSYAVQVEKEHKWLPKLALHLPLPIPEPLAIGEPALGYPWSWSVYRWLEGESATLENIADKDEFARNLAQFLGALHNIDTGGGPLPGSHNFYRGGALATYDTEARQAIAHLKGKIDERMASEIWEEALAHTWQRPPIWVHGDFSAGNFLVKKGRLSAVIDFGMLAVGDPACDLAIAWTFLDRKSREVFRSLLPFDASTWARGRGWTLWKALIVSASLTKSNAIESARPRAVIEEIFSDYRNKH